MVALFIYTMGALKLLYWFTTLLFSVLKLSAFYFVTGSLNFLLQHTCF
jgi:hypothetical protein